MSGRWQGAAVPGFNTSGHAACGVRHAAWLVGLLACGSIPLWAAEEVSRQGEPFAYDAKGHRDPFTPLVREGRLVEAQEGDQPGGAKPVLYGILWDPAGKSLAMINDAELMVGDTLGPFRVEEIRQDAVVLKRGDERTVLRIEFEQPSSKPSAPNAATGGEHR